MNLRVLALALIAGMVLPWGHPYTFMVRYLVMGMLFFAFLEMEVNRGTLQISHFQILLANLGLACLAYGLIEPWQHDLALLAFITAIMPTAAGAPVITGFLRGNVAYVTLSTLLTTVVIALLLPWMLPFLMGAQAEVDVFRLLPQVLGLLFLPLGLALLVRRYASRLKQALSRYRFLSFWFFTTSIYLAMSKASHFIQTEMEADWHLLLWIGLITAMLCLINFELGKRLGLPMGLEGGMALGRKNTMFSVWIALTFMGPIAALGPMFYIVWQNLYNYRQMHLLQKRDG